jgi:probable HAF family extracellular repeat protein
MSTAYSVSADGSVSVGPAWYMVSYAHPFRWDAKNGMVDLGALQGKSSRANAVSANGNVIAGWDQDPYPTTYDPWRGAIWWQGLGRLLQPFGWIGLAVGTNDCGSVIVGIGHPANMRHAFCYTAWDGRIEDLGALERGITESQKQQEDTSNAIAVSDDGNVVVGTSGWKPPLDAVIRTSETKMVKLSDYLTSKGVTGFDRLLLLGAAALTPDRKTITGTGMKPEGLLEGSW